MRLDGPLVSMNLSRRVLAFLWCLVGTLPSLAGTWRDHFSSPTLGTDWIGDRHAFKITAGSLDGQSASPLAGSPLYTVAVGTNWTDLKVEARVNVVAPNTRVCSKAALVLRCNGTNGYVFALHVATQTIELSQLGVGGKVLFSTPSPLQYQRWYDMRAEVQGKRSNSMLTKRGSALLWTTR